ncbi:MAG: hypothetical protein OXH68_17125 [Gammaproteobacteria bacterium]|nr:hypothetical protein [Gammaproteobacteria bacterium]
MAVSPAFRTTGQVSQTLGDDRERRISLDWRSEAYWPKGTLVNSATIAPLVFPIGPSGCRQRRDGDAPRPCFDALMAQRDVLKRNQRLPEWARQ